jgi:hypothetical protein
LHQGFERLESDHQLAGERFVSWRLVKDRGIERQRQRSQAFDSLAAAILDVGRFGGVD